MVITCDYEHFKMYPQPNIIWENITNFYKRDRLTFDGYRYFIVFEMIGGTKIEWYYNSHKKIRDEQLENLLKL